MRLASLAAMSTKTPKWAHEQEWRHIVFPRRGSQTSPVLLNGAEHHLVHMRTEGRPLVLAEVVIGPEQSLVIARERVARFLGGLGYGAGALEMPDIMQSKMPPRRS